VTQRQKTNGERGWIRTSDPRLKRVKGKRASKVSNDLAERRNKWKNAQAVFLALNHSFDSSPVEVGFNSLGDLGMIL